MDVALESRQISFYVVVLPSRRSGIPDEHGVNIANFTLGRAKAGGEAIALLYLDAAPAAPVLSELAATGLFQQIKPLEFDVA